MSMDIDLETIRQAFLVEAEEGLSAMEEALVALEARPDDREPLHEIFRTVHTLKGSAGMVGFDNVAEFAHLLEDALELFRSGEMHVTANHVTTLLQTVDALRGLLKGAAAGNTTHVRAADRALVARLVPGGEAAVAAPTGGAPVAAAGAGAPGEGARRRTLRVGMERLDALLNLTGETAVARGRLMQLLGQRRRAAGDDVVNAAEEVDRLFAELQEQVMRMRLVPLGPFFRQHVRTVRDTAALRGKVVRLVLEGEDVEVDASVVDHLRDPLTHMIRNAIDHGIELPAARRDAGKEPTGTITLRARHEGGTVVIELADDGAGLRRDRVLARARERGLVADGVELSDAEIHRLIMEPGFSTADRVSDLSGRGVGMDVVRRNVEALRGSIEIASRDGEGTTVTARLPLTVAIIDGFTVSVGDESYVIPLDAVTECLAMPADERRAGRCGVLSLRGEPLPYVRVRELFGLAGALPARENMVVVRHAGRLAGLVVDELLGGGQAVVKPLGKMFQRLPGVSGSTILGDGRVALILDVPDLLQRALDRDALPA